MPWLASRPPRKSRQSSPTNPSAACSTCRLAPRRPHPSATAATQRLRSWRSMERIVLPVSLALMEARVGATRRIPTMSISPNLSRRGSERSFAAGTWTRSTLLLSEKPPRPGPWRTRAWLTWPSALDWIISSEYSTSKHVSELPSPVDVSFSRRRRYIEPQFRIWPPRPV